jgi:hypothetical protein
MILGRCGQQLGDAGFKAINDEFESISVVGQLEQSLFCLFGFLWTWD